MSRSRTLRLFHKPTVHPHKLNLAYFAHVYSEEQFSFVRDNGVQAIVFQDGKLHIDNIHIVKPYYGVDMVTWKQQTKEHFTSGHLFFSRGGTELHGMIYKGKNADDAKEHHVTATSIPPVPYKTKITKTRLDAGTDPSKIPSGDWQDGLVLEIGFEQSIGENIPTPKVILNDNDISSYTSWSIDSVTHNTVLLFNLDSGIVCDFDNSLYLDGSIQFDVMKPLPTFSGTIAGKCSDQSGSGVYFWQGEAESQSAFHANLNFAPVLLSENDLIQNDNNLSVAELMSIVPDDSVSSTANDLLMENMKWAMGLNSTEKDWLSMFFGENPPVIPPGRQTLVNKSLNWYQQDFAKAYLGWSIANYSGPNAPTKNLNNDQKLKLKYYLQTGMAKDSDFNIQQNGIYIDAFIQAKPRLQSYLADAGGNWAQQLFDVITSPAQITLMINRVWGAAGQPGTMAPANNFATLLTVLQPSGDLASKYIQYVVTGTLGNTVHQTTFKDKDIIMQWMPDFLQEFLNQIATRGTVPDSAKLAAEQLQLMLQDMGGKMTDLASELTDFVINANGANLLEKTRNAESAFALKYPKFAKVGQMMFFAGWCMGVIMVIKAFQNWKDLKPEDKAKAIISAVGLGFQGLEIVPTFIQGIKNMGIEGWQKFTQWRNGIKTQDEMIEMNKLVDGEWVKNGATETTPLFDSATGTIKTAGTTWEAICDIASKVIAVVGIAVSAAFAVLSTIDFIDDLKEGQPITKTVFDGIMMVTNIATTVCLVLDLFVATTVFAMAAAVLAVVGIIVAIIEMFVVKPKNPLDDFMSATVIPFVNGLPNQTPPPGTSVKLQLA